MSSPTSPAPANGGAETFCTARTATAGKCATGRTSAPGVWAAGNVVGPRAQVIASAGSGNAAGVAINADLVDEDVRNALQRATVSTAPVQEVEFRGPAWVRGTHAARR